jgi:hypothetical protein
LDALAERSQPFAHRSLDALYSRDDLGAFGAFAIAVAHQLHADNALPIEDEDHRVGDSGGASTGFLIPDAIGIDDFASRVGQQRKRQPELRRRRGVGGGRIVADRDELNARRLDGFPAFLEGLKLGPAKGIPGMASVAADGSGGIV